MRVATITYARLISTGNYENIRVDASVELGPGEDSAVAWAIVHDTVHQALAAQLAEQLGTWLEWPRALGDDPRMAAKEQDEVLREIRQEEGGWP